MSSLGVRFSLPPSSLLAFPPSSLPHTLPLPSADHSSFISRAPFSIPSNLFHSSLQYKYPIALATSYVIVVKSWNAINTRRGGRPWAISKTRWFFWLVVLHNVFLAVYSAWTFVGITGAVSRSIANPFINPEGIRGTVDTLCRIQGSPGFGAASVPNSLSPSTYSPALSSSSTQTGRLWNEGLAFYGYLFYLSKFYEFIDTAIILLKGKQSSTLQTYHHMGAVWCMFVGVKYMSPPIWLFVFLNSFIHSLMYTYYTITSFNIRIPKPLKRALTTMQITQFIVGGSSAFIHLFISYIYPNDLPSYPINASQIKKTKGQERENYVPCLDTSGQAFAVYLNVIYLTPLTYLFARFFVRSYLRSTSAPTKKLERAGREAIGKVQREVEEDVSVTVKTTRVGVNGNGVVGNGNGNGMEVRSSALNGSGNGSGVAGRKGWEREKKIVD